MPSTAKSANVRFWLVVQLFTPPTYRAGTGIRVPVGYPGNKLPGEFFSTRRVPG